MNFNLKMQKEFKNFLKILKSYENMQESVSKISGNNLNNFRSNLKPLKDFFESFKDVLKRKIEPKNFNEDFNENQFETK